MKKNEVSTVSNNVIQTAPRQWNTEITKAKQEEIKNSVSARMEVNYKLEQDSMEGVDVAEWEE